MTPPIAELQLKLQELQALRDSGALSEADHAQARAPLERALVDQVMAAGPAAARAADTAADAAAGARVPAAMAPADPAPRAPRGLAAGLTAGVLLLALAGYAYTGSPVLALWGSGSAGSAANDASGATANAPAPTDEQVAEMVKRLAAHLQEQPDDVKGWAVLARAYAAMGRHAEAIPAFKKLLALGGENADVLADYADTLAAMTDGKLSPEGVKMVERALVLEPGNLKARAMMGSAAYDQGDYASAVAQWEQVAAALPPDNGFLPQLQGSIAKARQLAGLPAAAAAVTPGAGAAGSAVAATAAAERPSGIAANPNANANAALAVSGTITLAPALAAQAGPEDTVFVVARAASGPRMPLAVLRKQVKDLPLAFTLDDSMAMAATARISDHAQVVVVARISKSGQALPQAGDLAGQSIAVAPGASGLKVLIDTAVPGQ